MIKNSEKATKFLGSFKKVLNGAIADSMTIDKIAEMEDQEFRDYKAAAKAYQEFSELTIGIVEQMDEQSKILEELQRNMIMMSQAK